MSPRRRLVSDEARVVHLAQQFKPSYMREYLLWAEVWRRDPQNGRGLLRAPAGRALRRGDGLFWEVLDAGPGRVQAFPATAVRARLAARLEEEA